VAAAHPAGDLVQGVIGMHPGWPRLPVTGGLALQEGEHLAALLIESQRPRGASEPLVRQVGQQCVHSRRPGTSRAANRVPDPHCTVYVPALKPLFLHENILPQPKTALAPLRLAGSLPLVDADPVELLGQAGLEVADQQFVPEGDGGHALFWARLRPRGDG
jgi:hypothetical protein